MRTCRGCGSNQLRRVLDLGKVPAADHFPLASEPVSSAESSHLLAMELCACCSLVQLGDDDTVPDEPRGVEPEALREQAVDAIQRVADAGLLRGTTSREFGSPHGGSWLPLLTARGFAEAKSADVVVDCFGIMHEPDQRAAFRQRSAAAADGGVLLLQYHSLAAIVAQGQWNALRHGHFAYYSMTALERLLDDAGLSPVTAWEFDLYGGTVLVAAVHGRPGEQAPDESVCRIRDAESGVNDPSVLSGLQRAADLHTGSLRRWLQAKRAAGLRVYAYGAASRAVAVFHGAGVDSSLVTAIADAAPAKQGRRMPGTDVPIISPDALLAADPDRILLTLPDLLPEVSRRFPALSGRWVSDAWFARGGLERSDEIAMDANVGSRVAD
jgi:hypothetical protein